MALLAAYCRTWSEWATLTARSASWDFADESARKECRLLAATEDRLARLAAQFGLSPSSRTRVTPGPTVGPPVAKVPTRPRTKLDLLWEKHGGPPPYADDDPDSPLGDEEDA